MTEAKSEEEEELQTLDPNRQKRKPELGDAREYNKKPKNPEGDLNEGDDGVDDEKQKARALDKGKGKMVIQEEEEEESEDSDSDTDEIEAGGGDDDSDFCDDPLAEVDLENILPSRMRRRPPQEPGAYLLNDQDANDDDDDEDVVGDDDDDDDESDYMDKEGISIESSINPKQMRPCQGLQA